MHVSCQEKKEYSSHSLHRGGATFLSLVGASIPEIFQERGDWSSECVYEYLKAPLIAREQNDLRVSELQSDSLV